MDPCQRLLLERGYEALHDAAWDRGALRGSLTGVFLGFGGTDFTQMLAGSPAGGSVYAATGSSASIACGRLSYALGLHGPCVSHDTACSASLVACHAGLRALQRDECVDGLVAGVTLMLAPGVGVRFAGGDTPNPTYDEVASKRTTHYEVVEVVFDPRVAAPSGSAPGAAASTGVPPCLMGINMALMREPSIAQRLASVVLKQVPPTLRLIGIGLGRNDTRSSDSIRMS